MTVSLQTPRSKKDFGIVGYHQQKNASYLVFPKSLGKFKGMRVVGIRYELIEGTQVRGQLTPVKGKKSSNRIPPARLPLPRFRVTTRFTATVEVTDEVEAPNEAGAKRLAKEAARNKEVDFSDTPVAAQIVKVAKV